MWKLFALAALCVAGLATAEVYFKEDFSKGWEDRWVVSKHKGADAGEFKVSPGKFYEDAERDAGLQTTQDARFYQISAALPKPFSNKGKDLVFQFSVKHEQKIDCGGGYFKLMPKIENQEDFNGDTPYYIMFGPDICGSSTKKTHFIANYKGKNVLINKDVRCESDEFTHLYTLIVHPDNTYEIQIDGSEVQSGDLKEDFDFLEPREIKDPSVSKPADWVDEKMIVDPEDKKPEGYDDIPEQIADPDAEKPEDWDDELDGEWEAPMIPNPEFKGPWQPRMIENPEYKGEWVHPLIANPDFKDDDTIYQFDDIAAVGLEVWQVKAGTIFNNLLVTDDVKEAEKVVPQIEKLREAEKEQEKAKAEQERAAAEEASAHHADEEDEGEDAMDAAEDESKDEL